MNDFEHVFETHKAAVFRFLVRLTRNASDAEDLLQDVFLTFWRNARVDHEAAVLAYLRQIAYRQFLNQRTKTDRRARLAPDKRDRDVDSGVHTSVGDAEAVDFLLARVHEALDDLPSRARDAFVLFRFEGLSIRQIADLSDSPAKTVETRVRRATKMLADKLRKYQDHVPTR